MKILYSILTILIFSFNSHTQTIDSTESNLLELLRIEDGWVSEGGVHYRICAGIKCNGLVVDTFQNGSIKELSNYLNGKSDGLNVCFHPNGQIRMFGNYTKGRSIGEWKSYYENGKIYAVSIRGEGEAEKLTEYYESGRIESKREVTDDGYLLYDFLLEENTDTVVACIVSDWKTKTYKYVSFYDNGHVEQRGHLKCQTNKSLEPIGTWIYYDEEGKIIKIEEY